MTAHTEMTDAQKELFDQLDGVKAGMLGVEGSGQHMQPMSHYIDRDTRSLWFITASDTDLVHALGEHNKAHFNIRSTSENYYACMCGPLTISQDREKLDEIWNSIAAAWFEDGREDDKVTLLHMPLHEASVWTASSNRFVFGLEILKANFGSNARPDIGDHKIIEFLQAA